MARLDDDTIGIAENPALTEAPLSWGTWREKGFPLRNQDGVRFKFRHDCRNQTIAQAIVLRQHEFEVMILEGISKVSKGTNSKAESHLEQHFALKVQKGGHLFFLGPFA